MTDDGREPTGSISLDEVYAGLRPLMFAIAYRMLASASEAEDVVQEAFLRYHSATAHGTTIESPKAFLTTVTTRLAIDAIRSARAKRETYIGPWLPEPLLTPSDDDPFAHAEQQDSLSLAFLVLLQNLSPVERAVFLLREVFEYGYDDIAAIVQKSEDNCRQIFTRARKRIQAGQPRFDTNPKEQQELAIKFFAAVGQGDVTSLVDFLAQEVTFYGDGGGKAHAYPRPIYGRDDVILVLKSLFVAARAFKVNFQPTRVNGQPGMLSFDTEGRLINIMVLDIGDGRIQALRSIVNPDKLAHLGYPLSDLGWMKRKDN